MRIQELIKQENLETIANAEECGLVHTGEYEDGSPQFLGDNRAWAKFDDGNF